MVSSVSTSCTSTPYISSAPQNSSVKSPVKVLPGLPAPYSDFGEVFTKKPYDCPIDLVPGSSPPMGRVYPLSLPETKAVSAYIKENLDRGLSVIRKSSSPAAAGFFFVEKTVLSDPASIIEA